MKFYRLNNKDIIFKNYKTQLEKLKNKMSELDSAKYIKDLELMQKSLRHNLVVIKHESNSNIYFLMSKVTKANSFESPLSSFELKSFRASIEINQITLNLGVSQCLFVLEVQEPNDIDKFLIPLNEEVIKESFGNLENAEKLYKAANFYYDLNKSGTGSWIDVTRYFFKYEEFYKQYSYISFKQNPYYPFKSNTFEYDELNSVDQEAFKLLEEL